MSCQEISAELETKIFVSCKCRSFLQTKNFHTCWRGQDLYSCKLIVIFALNEACNRHCHVNLLTLLHLLCRLQLPKIKTAELHFGLCAVRKVQNFSLAELVLCFTEQPETLLSLQVYFFYLSSEIVVCFFFSRAVVTVAGSVNKYSSDKFLCMVVCSSRCANLLAPLPKEPNFNAIYMLNVNLLWFVIILADQQLVCFEDFLFWTAADSFRDRSAVNEMFLSSAAWSHTLFQSFSELNELQWKKCRTFGNLQFPQQKRGKALLNFFCRPLLERKNVCSSS